jgi:hypothetical protein
MSERDLALAERCEQAAGPDRELDCHIHALIEGRNIRPERWSETVRLHDHAVPRYTASLDAAVTLVPEGHEWLRKNEICMTVYRAPTDPKEWARHIDARGATPTLALCAAALRARSAML